MKFWPILGFVCVVSGSTLNAYTQNTKLKTMTCNVCIGPENDPFCHHPEQVECRPGEICYLIHLKSIGVAMGCSKTVKQNNYESEYCHRYKEQFEPFIARCTDCSYWDLCNRNAATVTKQFYPLVVVGVLMNVHLSV